MPVTWSVRGRNEKPRQRVGASAFFGAGNETRTRDPNLGKVVLYQLSYSRAERGNSSGARSSVKAKILLV